MSNDSRPFEEMARSRKVFALLEVFSERDATTGQVSNMDEFGWRIAEQIAGVKPTSETTRRLVIEALGIRTTAKAFPSKLVTDFDSLTEWAADKPAHGSSTLNAWEYNEAPGGDAIEELWSDTKDDNFVVLLPSKELAQWNTVTGIWEKRQFGELCRYCNAPDDDLSEARCCTSCHMEICMEPAQ